jgi:hypothetical protein
MSFGGATGGAVALLVAVFLACAVEVVEALTIVLAVGVTRGWRSTLLGVAAAVAVLIGLVAVLGPALANLRIDVLRVVVGGLLLVFGLQWLRKAILRAAGYTPLHDGIDLRAAMKVGGRRPSDRMAVCVSLAQKACWRALVSRSGLSRVAPAGWRGSTISRSSSLPGVLRVPLTRNENVSSSSLARCGVWTVLGMEGLGIEWPLADGRSVHSRVWWLRRLDWSCSSSRSGFGGKSLDTVTKNA